jgi:hypothetical protein
MNVDQRYLNKLDENSKIAGGNLRFSRHRGGTKQALMATWVVKQKTISVLSALSSWPMESIQLAPASRHADARVKKALTF